jgi:hypothetical protein
VYWRWRSIPELADLPQDQRRAVWYKALHDPVRLSDILFFPLIVGVILGLLAVASWLSTRSVWSIVLSFFVLLFLIDRLVNVVLVIRFRPVVR